MVEPGGEGADLEARGGRRRRRPPASSSASATWMVGIRVRAGGGSCGAGPVDWLMMEAGGVAAAGEQSAGGEQGSKALHGASPEAGGGAPPNG